MFLSKIWFVLVGLLAGAATTAAFVAPRAADRRIAELEGQRLDRAQYAAEQMLKKVEAHTWIDYAAKLSRDAVLGDTLDAASKGAGESRLHTDTVRMRLKTLAPDLDGIGLSAIGAVDARGRLIARIGQREAESGEMMGGLEVLSDALRGYLSDDVWGAGGRLERVAAVPVLSKGRDRIVGAVYVAAETGKRLAEVWKKNLDVDIALLLRGQVRTSTVPESFLGSLPNLIEERAKEIANAKRTRPIALTVGTDRLLAVAAPFPGQAGEQQAFFVLIGKMSPASSPLALLSTSTADNLGWSNFPWFGLTLMLAVLIGVGLVLQRIETEKPLSGLRAEVQKLARGELQKLNDTAFPGKFGGIARDVNASIERFTLAAPPRSETARKDLDAILGPAPTGGAQPASVFDLPQSHFGANAAAAPAFPSTAAPAFQPSPFAPPASPGLRPPAPGGAPPPSPSLSAPPPFPSGTTPPPMPFAPPRQTRPHATTPPVPTAALPVLPSGRSEAALAALGDEVPTSAQAGPSAAALAAMAPTPGPTALGGVRSTSPIDTVEPGSSDGARGADDSLLDEDGYDAHVKTVYDEYLATRERCGEAIGTLTLDRFRAKLDANRQQLVVKYSCRTARFSVYVKDGKAAIKATPVR